MSNENQKADQIAFHVYTKLTHVVNHARTTTDQRGQPKPDKWFNLETPDSDFFSKEDREPYRALSSYIHPTLPPPLEIQVLLTIPELASNQVLVHLDPDTNTRHRIEPTPRFILLESFILDFAHHGSTSSFSSSSSSTGVADIAPSTMYKHGIPLFRSLYTMLRVMPAWKVFKRLKRRIGRFGGGNMGIVVRLKEPGDDTLEFGTPLASQSHLLPSHILPTQSHTFVPVPHPHGTITLSLQYLTTPSFQIDDKESLFSSGFLAGDKAQSQQQRFGQSPPHVPTTTTTPMVSRQPPPPPPDPDVEFVPTLIKNQQRDSIASSAGLGYSTSSSPNHGRSNLSGLSREVTTQSIADRFILPPSQPQQSGVGSPGTAGAAMTQSRTAPASSMPGSGGFRTIPLPGSTGLGASTGAGAGSISGVGSGSGAGAGVGSNVGMGMGGMGSSGSFTGVGLLGGNRSRTNSPRTSPRKSLINLPGTVPLGVGIPSSSSSSSPLHGHGRTVSNPGSYTTSPAMVGTSPLQPLRDFPRMSSSPGSGAGGLGMVGTGTGISRPLSRLRTESTASTTGGGGSPSSLGLGLPGSLHGNPLSPSSSTAPTPPTPTRSGTSISPISVKPFKAGSLAGYSGVGSVGGVGTGASLTSSGLATRPSPPTLNTNTTTNALAFPSSMSAGGAGPAPVPVPSRKRYSSSFSHRYTSSLGGSGGSGGGGGGSGGGSAGAGVVGSVGAGAAAGGAGSVGSDKPRSKLSSPSSFHMAGDMDVDDDHDDISHFVREIDARKPLIGREKMMMEASSSRGGYHSRSRSVDVDEAGSRWRSEGTGLGRGGLAGGGGSRGVDEPALVDDLPPLVGPRYEPRSPLGRRSSTSVTAQRASSPAAAQRQQREPRPGLLLATGTSPVLTSADEIDERLRKMNEAFLASLEGLGSTTTSAGGSGSGQSSPTTATATRRSTNTSMSSAGRTGSSSSARVVEREREFGTLGRGREYWQQRPTVGAGGAGGLGALFSGSPEASGTADDVVVEEEAMSTASTSGRPLPPPPGERRPSPFLGRLRDQYATGGGGDSGSSSEVAALTGSGGSGSSMGIGLGRGGAMLPPHLGLGQMGQGSGSEEVIGRMDMEAELDSQVFGKRSR